MPFNIEDPNPPERFFWPESDGEEWVDLKLIDTDTQAEIDRQTMKKVVEYHHPKKANGKPNLRAPMQRFEYETETEPELRERLTVDAMISGWRLIDPQGNEIECTTDAKVRLYHGSMDFNLWVNRCLARMAEVKAERVEDLEKN